MSSKLLLLLLLPLQLSVCLSFVVRRDDPARIPRYGHVTIAARSLSPKVSSRWPSGSSSTRCFNFLKNAFENAFSNDRSLSTDKRKGQYDDIYTGEEYIDADEAANADDGLTEVQRKWRQAQARQQQSPTSNAQGGGGGGVTPAAVADIGLTLDFYLAGVPKKDPSNDLYGSRVNISSRDKGTGLSLPADPSVVGLELRFLDDGTCTVSESGFTSGDTGGIWRLSDDGSTIRVGIEALGYTRTVQTKGSIQKVYWTDEEEKSIQTSTTYSIPPGMVYGDIRVKPFRNSLDVAEKEGALRIEKSAGLFGISNQMVPCGKFVVVATVDRRPPTAPDA